MRYLRLVALLACLFGTTPMAFASHGWWQSHQVIQQVLNPAAITAKLGPSLIYFSTAFTLVGVAVVMISAIQRVAAARTGDESMGWVAGMVMTVALMVGGPTIGRGIFGVGDDLAKASGYRNADSIATAWKALRVVMPAQSPAEQVLATSEQTVESEDPKNKQDAAWTKRAWEWMKRSWGAMKNAASSFVAGLRDAVNSIIIFVVLLLPSLTLLLGMVTLAFGTFLRELLHHVLDVFLPLMIAFLWFAPTRGIGKTYLLRYVAVSLWPVAWALGNAIAISLLISTMDWVVTSCRETLGLSNFATQATIAPILAIGILPAAAPLMSWGLIVVLVLMIVFCATLLLASTLFAPIALSKTLTAGADFAEQQVKHALAILSEAGSLAGARGPGSVGSGGISRADGLGGGASAAVQRAGFAGAIARLGGPLGVAASFAMSAWRRSAGSPFGRESATLSEPANPSTRAATGFSMARSSAAETNPARTMLSARLSNSIAEVKNVS